MPLPTFKKCMLATAFTASFGMMQPAMAESEPVTNAEVSRTPNVVIIVADDLGHADAGFYQEGWNSDDIGDITPNIQKIAASGAVFNQGYVTAPVSGPSRAGLLTGRYQQRFGFYSNPAPEEDEQNENDVTVSSDVEPGTPVGIPTIGTHFKNEGYVTGFVGKLHDGEDWKFWPHNRGFDSFFGFNNGAAAYEVGVRNHENAIETPHSTMWHNYGRTGEAPTDKGEAYDAAKAAVDKFYSKLKEYTEIEVKNDPLGKYSFDKHRRTALKKIYGDIKLLNEIYSGYVKILDLNEFKDQLRSDLELVSGLTIAEDVAEDTEGDYLTDRFGIEAVKFIDEHSDEPFMLYVAFNAVHTPLKAEKEDIAKVNSVGGGFKDKESRKTALGMAYSLDENVGRIYNKLEEEGLVDDTIIVFVSDNGGKPESNFSSNEPFSGHKGELYEGGIRIPFAISWPNGNIAGGQFIDEPVSTLDILPTVLQASKRKIKSLDLDGINLLPHLQDASNKFEERYLYWDRVNKAAIRSGNYKLLKLRKQQYKLYDLSSNEEEFRLKADGETIKKSFELNLDNNKEKYEELKSELERWQKAHPVPTWGVKAPDKSIYQGEAEQK